MKNVPHWQWLVLLYAIGVALPVYIIHQKLKEYLLAKKTGRSVVLYLVALVSVAVVLNFICMSIYYKFIFTQ